jgi:hypothetical protein
MKRSRLTEEQIIGILKEPQAGLGAQELCRTHGVSDATFYRLGMYQTGRNDGGKLLKAGVRRRAADWAMTQKLYWQRRAGGLVGIYPRVCRRLPTRSEDSDLRARVKDLSSERRRFGYRRLHVLLQREG